METLVQSTKTRSAMHTVHDMYSITWPCTLFNNHPYTYLLTYTLLSVHAYGVQQPVCSVPSVFPAIKCKGTSYAQSKAQRPSPENFVAIGGCFTHYTYRDTALGCLKKLRSLESLRLLTVSGLPLKNGYYTCCYYYTADWGRHYKLLNVLLDASIWSLAMNRAYLEIGPPYIWTTLPRALNSLWTYSTNLVLYVRRLRGKNHYYRQKVYKDRY